MAGREDWYWYWCPPLTNVTRSQGEGALPVRTCCPWAHGYMFDVRTLWGSRVADSRLHAPLRCSCFVPVSRPLCVHLWKGATCGCEAALGPV